MPNSDSMSDPSPKLSVLDLAIVAEGSSPGEALRNSIDLARTRRAARLSPPLGRRAPQHAGHRELGAGGARRAPSPPHTETIRIGSGGVMLPNHAPLVVAEQFGMLEALHPGPHRPRHRPRAGHRPDHRRGAAALGRPALRRGLPAPARRADRLLHRRLSRGSPLSRDHRGARARRHARDLAARLERLLGPGRRHARPAVLLRPPLQRPQHRAGARALPRAASGPRSTSTSPTRWSRSP